MSYVGILPDGSRIALERVHPLWGSTRIYQQFQPTPTFVIEGGRLLGLEVDENDFKISEYNHVRMKVRDFIMKMNSDLDDTDCYLISIFEDGLISDGIKNTPNWTEGFIDDDYFHFKVDDGFITMRIGVDYEDYYLNPTWFYDEDFYVPGGRVYMEYTEAANWLLEIIAKYRNGHPGMKPPKYEPPKKRRVPREVK